MIRFLVVLVLLQVASVIVAQLTDNGARESADQIMSRLAPELDVNSSKVVRDSMNIRGEYREYIVVSYGTASISFLASGEVTGLSIDGRAIEPREAEPEAFRSDEEAWQAVESLLAELDFDLPTGLERESLEREEQGYKEFVYTFYLRPRPFGYGNSSGNYVCVQLHRVTGRVRHLSVSRGWQYETPNVRITEEQAVQKAIEIYGGSSSDWRGRQLRFSTVNYDRAPAYLKPLIEQRVMRLMYTVSSSKGSVMIDSVTGDVVDSWQIEGAENDGKHARGSGQESDTAASESSDRNMTLLPVALGGLIGLGVVVYVTRRKTIVSKLRDRG